MSGERSVELQQVIDSLVRTEDYLSLRVRQTRRLKIQTLLKERAEDIAAEDWAKLRFERGLIDAYEGNYREAIALWIALRDEPGLLGTDPPPPGPSEHGVHNILSATLSTYEAAIAAYEHSSPGDPADGVVLGLLNRYPEAIAAFSQVLADHPNDDRAWYNKAVTLRKLGRDQVALAAFDAALGINPDAIKAHYGRAMLLCDLGRHGKAAAAWDAVLRRQPNKLEALFAQGLSLTYLGQYREAIAAIGDLLGLDPADHEVLQYQGYAFRKLRRYRDAVEAYSSALDFRQIYRSTAHREVSYPSFVCQQFKQLKAAIAEDTIAVLESDADLPKTTPVEEADANPFDVAGLQDAPTGPELPLLVERIAPEAQDPDDFQPEP